MKGRMHHGRHHSPSGHHDLHHGGKHTEHSVGHTAKAAKKHHGSKVGGKGAKHRAGHRARGGMTPSSPNSNATVKALPFEKDTIPKEDEGGKGREGGR